MTFELKSPTGNFITGFFNAGLLSTLSYKIDTPSVKLKLDQNESPYDWPSSLKKKVLGRLKEENWNRYPAAYSEELENELAAYAGIAKGCVLLSPGSSHLVSLILSTFGAKASKVIVARPSFPLYESHLRYNDIPFQAWCLNKSLQYDVSLLPELTGNELVVFASPNNPVGNVLPRDKLQTLLANHPDTLFIADEAYAEFAEEVYTPLLEHHSNFLIIRTFSKALGAAGIRVGFLIGAQQYIQELKKIMLPYFLNRFALIAAMELLKDSEALRQLGTIISEVRAERDSLTNFLAILGQEKDFQVLKSHANFLLLRWSSEQKCIKSYHELITNGVLVRNVSKGPGLEGCLRITIGSPEENCQFRERFEQAIK